MDIKPLKLTIGQLVDGYSNKGDDGVVGYSGKLDIRPKYQREFIYDEKDEIAVINSVINGFPLNAIYFAVTKDGYEVLDGQQRILSLCRFLNGDFGFTPPGRTFAFFENLTKSEQKKIMNYNLMVYKCDGEDEEKLVWFKIINIAGKRLTDQELRNAVYAGTWVTEAKRYFSRTQGAAYNEGKDYVSGKANRQEILETAIIWACGNNEEEAICKFMAKHENDEDAEELWTDFRAVIAWVKRTFTEVRKEMKTVDWGALYDTYKDKKINPKKLEERIKDLMKDDDIDSKKGIYEYVLTGNKSALNLRAFKDSERRTLYERQEKKCANHKRSDCPTKGEEINIDEMEADHIEPWSEGGSTRLANAQMLCKSCNRRKGNK